MGKFVRYWAFCSVQLNTIPNQKAQQGGLLGEGEGVPDGGGGEGVGVPGGGADSGGGAEKVEERGGKRGSLYQS